ncbi:hypoxanthine phosphoribosyltransferase [Hymenobacter swuensis DY53]|uniref:Hypoxanthine phosphoribosyltransferase n=2 Tax=Hymenobacter TaxID=89966 RepID=W8ETG6_9BACT|nr:hypoxanthine phosphoribosyltransferase [Hymenobacter swuensis DY53]
MQEAAFLPGGRLFSATFAPPAHPRPNPKRMNPDHISLHNKQFEPYLSAAQLTAAIREVAARINQDYAGQQVLFVVVLNGSFMFAADLLKEISLDCEICFIRVASYQGTSSTGEVKEVLGLTEEIQGRHAIILEDIVDTGHTMRMLLDTLGARQPASLEVATLFLKPECLQHELPLRYIGLSIPNDFIVGYGLDFDGLGRNYPDVYKAV